MNDSLPSSFLGLSNFDHFIQSLVMPSLGVFGIIGNLINLRIMRLDSKQHRYSSEKCSIFGMSALACSDIMFCIGTLPMFNSLTRKESFPSNYHSYFMDLWIKTSTWYTLLISFLRYLVICHPLKYERIIDSKQIYIKS